MIDGRDDWTEDEIQGLQCAWCPTFFEEAHGYPVLCATCAGRETPEEIEDAGLRPALHPELRGDNDW